MKTPCYETKTFDFGPKMENGQDFLMLSGFSKKMSHSKNLKILSLL